MECLDPDHDHITTLRNSGGHQGTGEEVESFNNQPQLPHHHLVPQQPAAVH